uniref:Phospholipase/carboxylesterase/thioesterase domain-containing protein n=1 Tax=Noctiluca scintillans TaxID=2966 RepID=A0A7S0ZXU0_NOCSC|mmetsp:Transcript_2354/g.6795  ORF Transcript_2354/g.6795 Transcript_2354/m.6795 type:complete len:216 (+) Transcript_2354:65-712(+)
MAAILWLHGLGDTGAGWQGAFSAVSRKVANVKFHHPTAQVQPLSFEDGQKTTSWFDISTWQPPSAIGLQEPDRPAGLDETVAFVHQTLEDMESQGIPAERIILGGFSQGGTSSLLAGLTYPKRLGGIVSISGWATHRDTLVSEVSAANRDVPLWYSYGSNDPVIDPALASKSAEVLKSFLGESITVMEVQRGMHQPDGSEMRAVIDFMTSRLSSE